MPWSYEIKCYLTVTSIINSHLIDKLSFASEGTLIFQQRKAISEEQMQFAMRILLSFPLRFSTCPPLAYEKSFFFSGMKCIPVFIPLFITKI